MVSPAQGCSPLHLLPSLLPWSWVSIPTPALPFAWLPQPAGASPACAHISLCFPRRLAQLHAVNHAPALLSWSSVSPARPSWERKIEIFLCILPSRALNGSTQCQQENRDPLGAARCQPGGVAGLSPPPAAPGCSGQGEREVGGPWGLLCAFLVGPDTWPVCAGHPKLWDVSNCGLCAQPVS